MVVTHLALISTKATAIRRARQLLSPCTGRMHINGRDPFGGGNLHHQGCKFFGTVPLRTAPTHSFFYKESHDCLRVVLSWTTSEESTSHQDLICPWFTALELCCDNGGMRRVFFSLLVNTKPKRQFSHRNTSSDNVLTVFVQWHVFEPLSPKNQLYEKKNDKEGSWKFSLNHHQL